MVTTCSKTAGQGPIAYTSMKFLCQLHKVKYKLYKLKGSAYDFVVFITHHRGLVALGDPLGILLISHVVIKIPIILFIIPSTGISIYIYNEKGLNFAS